MVISLTGYKPSPRYDGESWKGARIEGTTNGTDWSTVESFDFLVRDADPTNPATRSLTTELVSSDVTDLRVVFYGDDISDTDVTDALPVYQPTTSLCTVRDVRVRLGRALSDDEQAQVEALIQQATVNILDAIDRDETFDIPTSAKPFMKGLCIELVSRAFGNPQALGQESETVGSYSYSRTYARDVGSGIYPTNQEALAVRRRVFGLNSTSAQVLSVADGYADSPDLLVSPW